MITQRFDKANMFNEIFHNAAVQLGINLVLYFAISGLTCLFFFEINVMTKTTKLKFIVKKKINKEIDEN